MNLQLSERGKFRQAVQIVLMAGGAVGIGLLPDAVNAQAPAGQTQGTATKDYTVKRGDTLGKIASDLRKEGIQGGLGSISRRILALNPQIGDGSRLSVGQVLKVPSAAPVAEAAPPPPPAVVEPAPAVVAPPPAVAVVPPPPPPPPSGDVTELDVIEVTGSRLPQPNLTATSSMTVISEEELDYQGTINIESLLNRMPQVFAEYSTGDSNGASGTATVSLRGLGSNRTLVLIDGKRLMPGDPFLEAPDLNFIPAALIDRIEILSGGASAVYGSDAVAGVVNFIMRRDFDGFRIDTEGTRTGEGDGTTRNLMAIWGTNVARGAGNVTMYAGFVNSEPITQAQRDFSECSITTPASGTTHTCAGSGTIAEGRIFSYDRYFNYYYSGPAFTPDYYGIVDPAGTRTFVADDGRTFNFAPFNYFQRPQERHQIGGFGHREISENLDIYADAMYMDDRTFAQIAPSGLFFTALNLPCNSPLLSQQQEDFLCNYVAGPSSAPAPGPAGTANVLIAKRTVEVGPRYDDLRHTANRITAGGKGHLAGPVKYDLSFQRGETILSETYINDLSVARIQDALNGCPSGNAACVPLDLFQQGAFTPAMADYIKGIGVSEATQVQEITALLFTADLGDWGAKIPTASTGIRLALGAEHRNESLDFRPDSAFQTGDLTGQGGEIKPVRGQYDVDEVFTEIQVPIVEDVPGVRLLRFDGAYRRSNYSLAGVANTYKAGLQYMPVQDIAFRASLQRAIRAPLINELFQPQSFGLFGFSDPCAGDNLVIPDTSTANPDDLIPNPTAPTLAQCQNTGVTTTQYNNGINDTDSSDGISGIADCSAGQCNGLFGGNIALRPEESDTKSFGFVFTPAFVKDFSVTVDYFDITVDKAIDDAPAVVFTQCLLTGDPTFCSYINRGSLGRIWGSTTANTNYVETPLINTSTFQTTGIDFEVDYKANMADWGMGERGRLKFNYVTTYLDRYEKELGVGTGVYDCSGLYGITCGTPNPHYRHKFRVTWSSVVGLDVSANWRYFGTATLDTSTNDPNLTSTAGRANVIDRELEAKNYLDLSGTYLLPFQGQKTTLRFGISNVLGEDPQVVSSNNPNPVSSPAFGNGNTFPNVYDISTVFFLGLTADF